LTIKRKLFLGHTEAIKNSASLIISIKHTQPLLRKAKASDVQPYGIVASCNTVHEVTELWSLYIVAVCPTHKSSLLVGTYVKVYSSETMAAKGSP
jgi:hypothetical protein